MNINTVKELEDKLAEPSEALIRDITMIEGDILILGLGGKMGPSLSRLAINAIKASGVNKKVIGVSRFSDKKMEASLKAAGIETIAGDLLDEQFLSSLPEVENVLYMAGNKFGTSGNEHFTWAMNSYLPGRVAEKFRKSRIVVFSSGNIYPFVPVGSGGADESIAPNPVGEYAQSCLGRERVFEHFSIKNQTPMLIYRLNYAVDLRYGILLEVAKSVFQGKPVDLTTGFVNVIWQGDANSHAIRSLLHCESSVNILNITGPETISIEWLAREFGKIMEKEVEYVGTSEPTALLNNAARSFELFGKPTIDLQQLIEWTSHWVISGGAELGKPTHFQERQGKF